jgi:hypothetical protein
MNLSVPRSVQRTSRFTSSKLTPTKLLPSGGFSRHPPLDIPNVKVAARCLSVTGRLVSAAAVGMWVMADSAWLAVASREGEIHSDHARMTRTADNLAEAKLGPPRPDHKHWSRAWQHPSG